MAVAVKKKSKFDMTSVKGIKITTPKGILSYPKLFKPEQYQGKGDAFYSATLLWGPKVDLKPMRIAVKKAKREAFGDDETKWPKEISVAFRNGDDKEDDPTYAGMTYASMKTKSRPLVVGPDREKIVDESEIYPGCIGVASIVIKATESGGKYYISFYLQGFMKTADGTALGGGGSVSDFDGVEVDDEELEDESDDDDIDDEDDAPPVKKKKKAKKVVVDDDDEDFDDSEDDDE